ncbi:glycosyltransferase family 4 protein [Bacteroidota bacterium]
MRIVFVTTYDAQDITEYSGTPFFIKKTFSEKGIELKFINNLLSIDKLSFSRRLRYILYNKVLRGKLGRYISYYQPQNLKFFARQVKEKLSEIDADIILSPSAIPIAYLDTNIPIVLWTDATFKVMHNYYGIYKKLSRRTVKDCHLYEKNALKRASLAIFSSEWAANSAIEYYGSDPDEVKVLPYGANIDCERTEDNIKTINENKSKSICKLLFIGQEWYRKGADVAVRIAINMNEKGINTELSIVGCLPPNSLPLPDYIDVHGFIKKSTKEGKNIINNLYAESHFFILPTIADCTPIVFAEANSYGLPVITTNTGGISSIIKDDFNGKMFGTEIDIRFCSDYLIKYFLDYDAYKEFSLKAFNEYKLRLNWESSISKIVAYFKEIIN